MKVKQINEQEVNSLLKDCPKQVQEYVKALKNLIEIKDHTNKKALDKIKQLSIQRVVLQSEQLFCNFDNIIDRSLTVGTEYKKIHEYNGLVLIINDLNELGLYDKKTFFRAK